MCASELAAVAGVASTSITYTLKLWRNVEPGALHIVGWKRQVGCGGRYGAVWALGPGKDVPKPLCDKNSTHRSWRQNNRLRLKLKDRARKGNPIPPWLAGLMP